MTKAQNRVFRIIGAFIRRKGYSPSFKEIGKLAGYSSLATIYWHVRALERDGYIQCGKYKQHRGITLAPCGVLKGFSICARSHLPLYFKDATCPLCAVRNNVGDSA